MIEILTVHLRKRRIYIHLRQISKRDKTDPINWQFNETDPIVLAGGKSGLSEDQS